MASFQIYPFFHIKKWPKGIYFNNDDEEEEEDHCRLQQVDFIPGQPIFMKMTFLN